LFVTTFYTSFSLHDTATTEIYTLSLHDALPIFVYCSSRFDAVDKAAKLFEQNQNKQVAVSKNVKKVIRQIRAYIHKDYYLGEFLDRKSTRLNSSHVKISYAVFCLKKKKKKYIKI